MSVNSVNPGGTIMKIFRFLWSWVVARYIPAGYEDESGFHYGNP